MENNKTNYKEVISSNIYSYIENNELVDLYYKYIEEVVDFFDKLIRDKSDLFYSVFFDILVQKGLFSATNKIVFTNNDFKELSLKFGLNVINGVASCRNIACFYEDIFCVFYRYPLKICCYDKLIDTKNTGEAYGNHVINITKHDDTLYGIDFRNHSIFTFTGSDELKLMGGNYTLQYFPDADVLLKAVSNTSYRRNIINEVDREKLIIEEAYKKPIITKEEYLKLLEEVKEFYLNKEHVIQSFMFKNKSLQNDIKEKMLSLK